MANWDPSALGSLDRLRWDFLDNTSVTASSGAVSKISNKGSLGTSGDLRQSNTSTQPSYSNGVLTTNGSTYVVTNALQASAIFSSLQTGIFYGIVKYISGSVWFNCEISGGGSNRFGAEGSARVDWPNGSSGSAQGFSPNLSNSSIIVVQKTTTALNIRVNGTQVASVSEALKNTDGTAGVALGAQNGGGYPGAAEFRSAFGCIDDYTLDTAQRVEGWLAWRMSDTGDSSYLNALPTGHPYKSSRPTITTGGASSYTLSAAVASLAITGRDAAISHIFSLACAFASFRLTGASPSSRIGRFGSPGSFTITARPAGQGVGRAAAPGAFAITGQPTSQGHLFTLACGAGSLQVAGLPAARGLARSGLGGACAVSPFASTKMVGRLSTPASLAIRGGAASRGLSRYASSGAFAMTGAPAGYTYNHAGSYVLGASTGQYTVSMFADGSTKPRPFMKRKRVRFGLSP